MSHCSLSPEQKGVMGISENLLRLSVGIEDYRDLVEDLDGALKALVAVRAAGSSRGLPASKICADRGSGLARDHFEGFPSGLGRMNDPFDLVLDQQPLLA
jgi:hypothetical protein